MGRYPADARPRGYRPSKVIRDTIDKAKADLGEDWQAAVTQAIISRRGSVLSALELAFQAGKHGEVSFIEWLDREALVAYVHINPCITT